MKIFLAGVEDQTFQQVIKKVGHKQVLISFYYMKNKDLRKWKSFFDYDVEIFLDCGAYTAWTKGETINLNEYINYVRKYKDIISIYPNLDIKGDNEQTDKNYQIMKKAGLNPLPVYHMNRNEWDVLEKMCQQSNYVALGAIAGERVDKDILKRNLRRAIEIAKPYKTKFHAFGLTSFSALFDFPLYSADFTSWLQGAKTGVFYVFNPKIKRIEGIHWKEKKVFRHKTFIDQSGADYNKVILRERYKDRLIVCAYSYKKQAEYLDNLHRKRELIYWNDDVNVSSEKKNNGANKVYSKKGAIGAKKLKELWANEKMAQKIKKKIALVAKGNTWALKHGLYSEYHPAPPYVKALLEEIDKLDLDDPKKVKEVAQQIIKNRLKTFFVNTYYEAKDGWVQDKSLSDLAKDLVAILTGKGTNNVQVNTQINLLEEDMSIEELDERIKGIEAKIKKIEAQKNRKGSTE